jgi:hypothetical protein
MTEEDTRRFRAGGRRGEGTNVHHSRSVQVLFRPGTTSFRCQPGQRSSVPKEVYSAPTLPAAG